MPRYNNSVENIAKILSLFSYARPNWGVSEIGRELGLSKTTAFYLTSTLEKIGFLLQNEETRKYELGLGIANLASIMSTNLELSQKGAGIAQAISSTYGLSCNLGIWGDNIAIVIFSCEPSHTLQIPSFQVGPRIPGYCTAMGRALLAYMDRSEVKKYLDQVKIIRYTPKTKINKTEIIKELDETKARGFSISNEEVAPNAVSIGAPIFDKENCITGAITIRGHVDHMLAQEMKNLPSSLSLKALQISQTLGYGGN